MRKTKVRKHARPSRPRCKVCGERRPVASYGWCEACLAATRDDQAADEYQADPLPWWCE